VQRCLHVSRGAHAQLMLQLGLLQAAGRGIGRPSFRVIQNHFALESNVGDVAAKEEVWEVTAQLAGLALSIGVLELLEGQSGNAAVKIVGAWCVAQGLHLLFRCVPAGKQLST
jgi:Vitamin B6 photo-protection and homoeostasis